MKTSDETKQLTLEQAKEMATQVMRDRKCSWREACHIVKRMRADARNAFKGEPLPV